MTTYHGQEDVVLSKGRIIKLFQGQEEVVLSKGRIIKLFQGIVTGPDGPPMEDALVEVFDDPDVILMKYSDKVAKRRAKQHRMAACNTGDDGKFCFNAIRPGKYELRCSKTGFNSTSLIVRLDPQRMQKEELEVVLGVSN